MIIDVTAQEIDDCLSGLAKAGIELPEVIPARLFGEFMVMRRKVHKKKVKTTKRAVTVIIGKLVRYEEIGWPCEVVLRNALEGEWQTVHLPHGEPPKRPALKAPPALKKTVDQLNNKIPGDPAEARRKAEAARQQVREALGL